MIFQPWKSVPESRMGDHQPISGRKATDILVKGVARDLHDGRISRRLTQDANGIGVMGGYSPSPDFPCL